MANKKLCQKRQGIDSAHSIVLISKRSRFLSGTKNQFQAIADAYSTWYEHCQKVSQTSNSVYFYCDPWEVDFELPPGALETALDRFLADT